MSKKITHEDARDAKKMQNTAQNPDLVPEERRPISGGLPTMMEMGRIEEKVNDLIVVLENFSQHLRPMDRMRKNSIQDRNLGFARAALILAQQNQQFLPHWLPIEVFDKDAESFEKLFELSNMVNQCREWLWNLQITVADRFYTDALEFYSQVQDASQRRIDAAESPYRQLRRFFRRNKPELEEPTEAEEIRDAKAILHGRKDGKVVIEGEKARKIPARRKLLDESIKAIKKVKETYDEDDED